ncbi:MAG: MlaD family protein [Candidatus Tyrphobacter sp.]
MTKQAVVGLFAIVAIALLFIIFYILQNLGARTGYQLAIHFDSAAGLQSGYGVFFSGLAVGTVDRIVLLPDDTVDVVVSIHHNIGIPRNSRFLIQAPLTGASSLVIVPPRGGPLPYPTFAPGIAPIADQPKGQNVATVQDLLQQGQGEIRRLDIILAELQRREPRMLATLQRTLTDASEMTRTLNASLSSAGENIAAMAATLNSTASLDAPKLDRMLEQVSAASVELHRSMSAIEGFATDPRLRGNVIATTENIAQTTHALAEITSDLQSVTANPQTQEQMRDTIAHLDATLQRAAFLLGRLGGRSHVYGVDRGATPPPAGTPQPQSSPHPLERSERLAMGGTLSGLARQLIALQLRVGELDAQHVCCPSALFSADRGPQVDLNAILLPNASTSVMFGANDVGHATTWNLAALHRVAPDVRVGGGLLYSRLGVLGQYDVHGTGIGARFYDPRRPTLDLYGDVHLTPWAQLFLGERAINQPERRTDYGIQFSY